MYILIDWKGNRWSVGELAGTMHRLAEGKEWTIGLDMHVYEWANLYFDSDVDEICPRSSALMVMLQSSHPAQCRMSTVRCCKDSKGVMYCRDAHPNTCPVLYEVCEMHCAC